jgi:hypothetical protein
MIDESKMAKISAPAQDARDLKASLRAMPVKDLRNLLTIVEELLPDTSVQKVKDLDLEDELMQQYTKTKDLMDECIKDPEIAPNQKAQVANSVVSTLGHLVKLQEDLRLQQTIKLMETVLIDVIKTLPKETKDSFFAEYEEQAKKAGLM